MSADFSEGESGNLSENRAHLASTDSIMASIQVKQIHVSVSVVLGLGVCFLSCCFSN
jgi:hypothetical protein